MMILKTVIMRLKNVDFMRYILTSYPIIMIYYGYFFQICDWNKKYTDSLSTELLREFLSILLSGEDK